MSVASTTQAEIMERFLAAADAKDAAGMAKLAHPAIVMEWPQSGERFVGRDNALAAYLATEVKPDIAGEPIMVGSGDLWVLRMPLRYGADVYRYVGIFELEDGLVRRTTEFFAAPFPASDARAPYAEPAPEAGVAG